MKQKKAMHALYKLEQAIIALVKENRQIVSLANDFDSYWREKTGNSSLHIWNAICFTA